MELLTVILFGIATAVSGLVFLDKLFPKLRYRLPPGPRGLPLLGCPWYMFRDIHIVFTELAEIWGDCFSVNILGQRMVVLNTPEVVRDAYRKGVAFAGRPPHPSYINHLENSTVFLAPNQQWTKQRKLIHRILNMYGEGVQAGEGVIHEELSHVAEWLEKHQGSPVNLDDVIFPGVNNVLTILMTHNDHRDVKPLSLKPELGSNLLYPSHAHVLQIGVPISAFREDTLVSGHHHTYKSQYTNCRVDTTGETLTTGSWGGVQLHNYRSNVGMRYGSATGSRPDTRQRGDNKDRYEPTRGAIEQEFDRKYGSHENSYENIDYNRQSQVLETPGNIDDVNAKLFKNSGFSFLDRN